MIIFNEYLHFFPDLFPTKSPIHSGHLNKRDISAPYPQSRNLVEIDTQKTSNTRPLPPVPHINL